MTDTSKVEVKSGPRLRVVGDGDTATKVVDPREAAASAVLAKFAEDTEALSVECTPMSAYIVVVWDDHGFPHVAFKLGENNPVPQMMVPGIVKDILTTEMFGP